MSIIAGVSVIGQYKDCPKVWVIDTLCAALILASEDVMAKYVEGRIHRTYSDL